MKEDEKETTNMSIQRIIIHKTATHVICAVLMKFVFDWQCMKYVKE